MQLIDIFSKAVEISDPDERMAFVENACKADSPLRNQVFKMLDQYYDPATFMAGPAVDAAALSDDDKAAAPTSEKPGDRIGRYKLLEKIGEGGMGLIYMAEQQEPVIRRVALKIIKWGMDTKQVLARFDAERQALALMNHPNIAKILDAGSTETGRSYFVMELVQGTAITDFCNEYKLNTEERLKLFISVCSAVQHAHQKGIIHRDIKPSNVLVTFVDDHPVAKVIDFGIAKATQQRLTEKTLFTNFHLFIGTPAYMSPEQAKIGAQDIDTRSDIYSLGVLLYELLTGHPPFSNQELMSGGYDEIRRRVRESEPPRPSRKLSSLVKKERTEIAQQRRIESESLDKTLKGDLDWIVMKALEKDRTRRYDSSSNFADDIHRYLTHEPVSAVAPSHIYKFKKFARRNKTSLVTAGIILLTLVIATFTSTSGWIQANEQRNLAEDATRLSEQRREEGRLNLYVAEMAGVHRAILENGDMSRTRGVLPNHIPIHPDDTDYRGFEWRYLWTASNPKRGLPANTKVFKGHTDMPTATMGFSPDGRHLISGGRDKLAIVWDAESAKMLHRMEHPAWVTATALSRDSRFAATLSENTVRIWTISEPEVALWDQITTSHNSYFQDGHRRRLIFSPNQDLIAYDLPTHGGESQHRVTIYNYINKEVVQHLPEAGQCLALSPDGRILITKSRPRGLASVNFWDLENQGALLCTRTNLDAQLSFSSAGDTLFASSSGRLQSWNTEDVTNPQTRIVNSIFSNANLDYRTTASLDGDLLVTENETVQSYLVDLNTKERYVLGGKFRNFSPDSSQVLLQSSRTNLFLVDTSSLLQTNLLKEVLYSFSFTPDGRHVALARRDAPMSLYRTSDLELVRPIMPEDHSDDPLEFLSNGEELVTAIFNGNSVTLRLIDVNSGEVVRERSLSGAPATIGISNDGLIAGILFKNGRLQIVATQSMKVVKELMMTEAIYGTLDIVFSPDNSVLAIAPDYKSIQLYDTANWQLIESIPNQHSVIGFIDEGRKLLSWTTKGKVFEHNLVTAEGQPLFSTTGTQIGFAISPDEKTIATGGYRDGSIQLWNLATGQVMTTFKIEGKTKFIKFSPDGKLLLAVTIPHEKYGKDWHGTLRYWRAPSFEEIDEEIKAAAL